jgi:hypothetical protein
MFGAASIALPSKNTPRRIHTHLEKQWRCFQTVIKLKANLP